MSETVCRRAGCTNLLSDEDDANLYEHCSTDCNEANDDLDDHEYAEKQQHHDAEMIQTRDSKRSRRR